MSVDSILQDSSALNYGVYFKSFHKDWNSCIDSQAGIDLTKQFILRNQLFHSFDKDSLFINLYRDQFSYRIPYGAQIGEKFSFNTGCNIEYVNSYNTEIFGEAAEIKEFELTRKGTNLIIDTIQLSKKFGLIQFSAPPYLDLETPSTYRVVIKGMEYSNGTKLGLTTPQFDGFKYAVDDTLFVNEMTLQIDDFGIQRHVVSVLNVDTTNGEYKIELSSNLGGKKIIDLTSFQKLLNNVENPSNNLRRSDNDSSWHVLMDISKYGWNEEFRFQRLSGDSCSFQPVFSVGNPLSDTIISNSYGLSRWGDFVGHWFYVTKVNGKNYNYSLGTEEADLSHLNLYLKLYPNPVLDVLNLNSNISTANIRCMDISGALVMNKGVNFPAQLDVRTLKSGVYFIQLELPNGKFENLKFVKN